MHKNEQGKCHVNLSIKPIIYSYQFTIMSHFTTTRMWNIPTKIEFERSLKIGLKLPISVLPFYKIHFLGVQFLILRSLMIRNLPYLERPRERCLDSGPSCLSLRECIAVILCSGPPGIGSLGIASRILERPGSGLGTSLEERAFF